MTWLEGESLMHFTSANLEVRNCLARLLFHAWYVPFYRYGVIHADPHLGNYTVGEELSVNLLDFGCVRRFEKDFVAEYARIGRAAVLAVSPKAVKSLIPSVPTLPT